MQLIPARNNPENIEEYACLPNETKLVVPLYDVNSSKFLGLEKRLVFVMVRGDQDETFFSYGYDKAKSNTLYSASEKVIPNIFSGTCFEKHQIFLLEQRTRQEASTLCFYLPSTTDRCHSINQYRDHVSLHPIDCPYENFRQYSKTGEDFMPQDLELRDLVARQLKLSVEKQLKNVVEKRELKNVARQLKLYKKFSRARLKFLTQK